MAHGEAATACGPASGARTPERRRIRWTRALLAPLAAIAFLSVLVAPASASIQFDQQWGSIGILNGQFSVPNRVATDSSGNVYVTDAGNTRIQKFSSSGVFITKWGSLGTGDGQFLSPQGIATDTAGNVYVVDGQANRIQKFGSSGTFITKWGALGAGNGQFNGPRGIAIDSSDNVYVTDGNNGRIQKFNSSGTFVTAWGSVGTGDGQFSVPSGVATDSSGNVYVADAGNARIQKFNSSGTFITKWGSVGTGDGQFGAGTTLDVATGAFGNVLVSDPTNNRIEKFRPSGTFITKWGALGSGTGQFTTPSGVATDSSDHVFVVDQGNNRVEKFHETDTTAPDSAIDSGPSGVSNASVSFTFSSTEPQLLGFECLLAPSDWASCISPRAYSNLAEGSHTFQVRAVDAAGNPDASPAALTWMVDRTSPETTIDSGPSGPTSDASPSFGFSSEVGASFECRLDAGVYASCNSPKPYSSLSDGLHAFEVRATDPVGNTDPSPASRSFTVDTAAPETTIDSGPSGLTNDASPSFGFSSEAGATFECRLDSSQEADFQPCSSPQPYSSLADGAHTFEVRATDSLGNTDPTPASRSFTVDTAAPETTIDSGPSGLTNNASPSFGFSSEAGASFECRLDGGAYAPCSSPKSYSSLSDGPHAFEVRATDSVGNTDPTPASRSFTVDTTPPETQIDFGPSGSTNDTSASFGFSSEAGASFECKLDAGAYAPCSSPKSYSSLADGLHTFRVRATDSAGHTDLTPASRSFTVDTVPPNTSIISGPSGGPSSHLTVDPTPTFTFSSSQAGSSFECKFGSNPYGACPSPWTAPHLADGTYTLYVRATDAAGNVDPTPASLGFSVHTASISVVGSRVVVKAASGAQDNLSITSPSPSTLRVTDFPNSPYRGSGVHTGAGCTRSGDYIANCNAAGITLITVNSADLTDRVANLTAVKSSLVGGGAADVLIGGSNNDNLTGLAGADVMRGMNGNDRLYGHDGSSDKMIDCDGGDFPGTADQADLDMLPKDPDSRVFGCETVTRH